MTQATLSGRLAGFAAQLAQRDVPRPVLGKLQAALLYGLTVAVAQHDADDPVQRAMPQLHAAPGPCTLIGSTQSRAAPDAAAINAARMFARNQVDTHVDCLGHLGCVVVPAVLALAQARGASADRVVSALLAGFEVIPRVGRSAVSSVVARGFRGTSVFGVFGAAVAAGQVIGLDEARLAHAIAMAASRAAGITQCFADGTQEAALHVADACRAGVECALLAEAGVQGAPLALEGDAGFYKAFAGVDGVLGLDGWCLPEVTFKPTPGCVINQQPVQIVLALRERHTIRPDDVAAVRVALRPADAAYPGIDSFGPFATRQGACMSTAFMVDVALAQGRLTFDDFSLRHGPDPVHARSRRVQVLSDASLGGLGCEVSIEMADGRVFAQKSSPATSMDYDLPGTRRLCDVIAGEWPASRAGQAPADLAVLIEQLVIARGPGAAQALAQWLAA
jgi:2-methylcitrate dehydratase PrpD